MSDFRQWAIDCHKNNLAFHKGKRQTDKRQLMIRNTEFILERLAAGCDRSEWEALCQKSGPAKIDLRLEAEKI